MPGDAMSEAMAHQLLAVGACAAATVAACTYIMASGTYGSRCAPAWERLSEGAHRRFAMHIVHLLHALAVAPLAASALVQLSYHLRSAEVADSCLDVEGNSAKLAVAPMPPSGIIATGISCTVLIFEAALALRFECGCRARDCARPLTAALLLLLPAIIWPY